MKEAALVALIRRRFRGLVAASAIGLDDDAAVLPPARRGYERVISVDQVHEGVHFTIGSGTESAGWRAIVRNLSDLAAMGAAPVGFVWTLALTPAWLDDDARLLDGFLRGAARACRRYGLPLLGGDLSSSRGAFSCVVTVLGDAKGSALRRSGARSDDVVYVSRALGAAHRGLALLDEPGRTLSARERQALRAHLWPEPELALGLRLGARATSCMDLSDGLATDANRLARASAVAVHLDTGALGAAVHPAAGDAHASGLEHALRGGDDYALLFTLPKRARPPRGCLRIGDVRPGTGVWLDGKKLTYVGFEHFVA